LRRADHSSKEFYRPCKKDYVTEEEARDQQRAVEPLMDESIGDIVTVLKGKHKNVALVVFCSSKFHATGMSNVMNMPLRYVIAFERIYTQGHSLRH
jgi:hypothetical protein